MSMIGIWGWDIAAATWYKVGANILGELLIDTDALETLIAARIPADIEDITFNVEEQGTPAQHCYGWVGDVWYHLLVESAANPNLRTHLYDAALPIHSAYFSLSHMDYKMGLCVAAQMYAKYTTDYMYPVIASIVTDNITTSIVAPRIISDLYGFDGTYWDRLRTYGVGILKVGRAPIGATITRMTGTGPVGVAGAHDLYWIACSPDDPNAEWELTDAIAAGGTVVYDHFDNDKHSEHITFDPPMPFSTGIYVEKFDHQKSLVFCYI